MPKHKYKSCKFDKKNRCQKKNSAGHAGTIKSVKKKYCAKVIENNKNVELKFYERNCSNHETKKREICKYLPAYNGICIDKDKVQHIVLEDLTRDMKHPSVMDVKMGKITASYTQLIGKKKNISLCKKMKYYTKKVRHQLIAYITISNRYGFRAISLPSNKIKGRIRIGMLHPQKVFSIYFKKDTKKKALKAILRKLRNINRFVQSERFYEYSFIGSSVLFIYDNTPGKRHNVNVAMIDFNRSRQSKRMTENEKKYRERFREGMQNLFDELLTFSKK